MALGTFAWGQLIIKISAAPHLPAGIFSPYSDGEKDALIADFANRQRCRKGAGVAASPFRPVYGEKCPAGQ
jgi:hypothetical protein